MKAEECRVWRERIGALVLGQLTEDERFATEAHLDGCPACRAEAEALAPVAALLSRADPDRLTPAPGAAAGPRRPDRPADRGRAPRRSPQADAAHAWPGRGGAAAAAAAARCSSSSWGARRTSRPTETVAFRSLPHGASPRPPWSPAPGGARSASTSAAFGAAPYARCGCAAQTASECPAGSFRYVYEGESNEAELSSALSPRDATAIGLRAGSKTYVRLCPRARSARRPLTRSSRTTERKPIA